MKVLVDIDGVVADFVAGAMKLHGKPYPYGDPANRGEHGWNIEKLWDIPPHVFWSPMEFDFWADLDPTPEADAIIKILMDEFGLSNLCFLTSPISASGCVEGKRAWVGRHFSDIPILFSVRSHAPESTPPKQFLASDESLLIDDYTVNVENFWNAGGEAFLFPRPWNRRHREEPEAVEKLEYAVKHCY